MAESEKTLNAELARLLTVMADARNRGNESLADLLANQAAKYLAMIADVRAQAKEVPAQQQQQTQPAKGEPDEKD